MTYFIESDKHWRISKSGYSIKVGFTDGARIVCAYPFAREPGQLDGKKFSLWLEDAEHICELHNASLESESTISELRARIASLEAEKADAKRAETSLRPLYAAPPIPRVEQEPVAWVLFDDIFIAPKDMSDDPPNLECMKPLYAHPLAMREPTEDESSRIAIEAGHRLKTEAARIAIGRAMFNAVRKGMTK